MSVCRLHVNKMIYWSIFPDAVYGYADKDTDDRNSHNVFQFVRILSWYGYVDQDPDTET